MPFPMDEKSENRKFRRFLDDSNGFLAKSAIGIEIPTADPHDSNRPNNFIDQRNKMMSQSFIFTPPSKNESLAPSSFPARAAVQARDGNRTSAAEARASLAATPGARREEEEEEEVEVGERV